MSALDQRTRWRCLTVGCNPKMIGGDAAVAHRDSTGHRIAKWPIRSAEGKRRARVRNRTGYYDKYNVGAKSRGESYGSAFPGEDDHPFSPEALGQD